MHRLIHWCWALVCLALVAAGASSVEGDAVPIAQHLVRTSQEVTLELDASYVVMPDLAGAVVIHSPDGTFQEAHILEPWHREPVVFTLASGVAVVTLLNVDSSLVFEVVASTLPEPNGMWQLGRLDVASDVPALFVGEARKSWDGRGEAAHGYLSLRAGLSQAGVGLHQVGACLFVEDDGCQRGLSMFGPGVSLGDEGSSEASLIIDLGIVGVRDMLTARLTSQSINTDHGATSSVVVWPSVIDPALITPG